VGIIVSLDCRIINGQFQDITGRAVVTPYVSFLTFDLKRPKIKTWVNMMSSFGFRLRHHLIFFRDAILNEDSLPWMRAQLARLNCYTPGTIPEGSNLALLEEEVETQIRRCGPKKGLSPNFGKMFPVAATILRDQQHTLKHAVSPTTNSQLGVPARVLSGWYATAIPC